MVSVAERGSLRNAARQLGITQPALTRSIQELEQELGEVLFERHGTGMHLTKVGQVVLQRAAGIQADISRLRDEVAQIKGLRTGSVTIGMASVAQIALMPRVAKPFLSRYPDVQLNIHEGMFSAVEAELQSGVLDFYVGPMSGVKNAADFVIEPLFRNRRTVFCRIGHPLAHATSITELADAKWIVGALAQMAEEQLGPLFERYGLPHPNIAARGQTFLSMTMMAASTDLLAMLPQQWFDLLLATGKLIDIPLKEPLDGATICTVRRASLPLTPIAEHLSDLFRRAAINHARTLPGDPVIAA